MPRRGGKSVRLGAMSDLVVVPTPDGPGELLLAQAPTPRAGLLLGHGAGGGIDSWDLALLAARLPQVGISVARYRQPWLVRGSKVAGPPASLDRAWLPALVEIRRAWAGQPLFVGGRSAGARCACRCYSPAEAGLVLLSFPLHPPGQPGKSRAGELAAIQAPTVLLQGERDPFGTPAELALALAEGRPDTRIVEVPGATHSLEPGKGLSRAAVAERENLLVEGVVSLILGQEQAAPAVGVRPGTR